MSDKLIYKILRAGEWQVFRDHERFAGSPDDLRDGFIHFSTAIQVPKTLKSYFATVEGLHLVAFSAESFGGDLKWEASTGGDLYPHLYAPLLREMMTLSYALSVIDGIHQLSQEILEKVP